MSTLFDRFIGNKQIDAATAVKITDLVSIRHTLSNTPVRLNEYMAEAIKQSNPTVVAEIFQLCVDLNINYKIPASLLKFDKTSAVHVLMQNIVDSIPISEKECDKVPHDTLVFCAQGVTWSFSVDTLPRRAFYQVQVKNKLEESIGHSALIQLADNVFVYEIGLKRLTNQYSTALVNLTPAISMYLVDAQLGAFTDLVTVYAMSISNERAKAVPSDERTSPGLIMSLQDRVSQFKIRSGNLTDPQLTMLLIVLPEDSALRQLLVYEQNFRAKPSTSLAELTCYHTRNLIAEVAFALHSKFDDEETQRLCPQYLKPLANLHTLNVDYDSEHMARAILSAIPNMATLVPNIVNYILKINPKWYLSLTMQNYFHQACDDKINGLHLARNAQFTLPSLMLAHTSCERSMEATYTTNLFISPNLYALFYSDRQVPDSQAQARRAFQYILSMPETFCLEVATAKNGLALASIGFLLGVCTPIKQTYLITKIFLTQSETRVLTAISNHPLKTWFAMWWKTFDDTKTPHFYPLLLPVSILEINMLICALAYAVY